MAPELLFAAGERAGTSALKSVSDRPNPLLTLVTEGFRMNARLKQLRDLVVALDLDRPQGRAHDSPEGYQDAARKALRLTHEEMGLLPIADFAGPVNPLQTLAENIYFRANGSFADLDATGRAGTAKIEAKTLLARMRPVRPGTAEAIAEALFARIRSRSAA